MARLTKWRNFKKKLCIEVCEEKCIEGYSECHKCKPFRDVMKKLAEYEDAEEQGLLFRLPCKVGTHIYIINRWWIDEGHICGIAECDDTDCACFKVYEDPDTYTIVAFDEFGKTWFLTETEAKAALKKMQEGE